MKISFNGQEVLFSDISVHTDCGVWNQSGDWNIVQY